jgi:galactonate dehydratase
VGRYRIAEVETVLAHEWLFVRIRTDDGVEGVGQSAHWGYPDATERVVAGFSDLLVARDPLAIGRLGLELYRSAPFRGGVVSGAVAAVDIALWDLAGRLLEVPVHQLLGGAHRDRARLHAVLGSGWFDDRSTVDDVVAAVERAVGLGFTAVKFDPLPEGPNGFQGDSWSRVLAHVVETVGAVREAVGWDVDLMVELHRRFSPGEAVAVAAELERFRLYFMEDPLPIDSVDSWGEIASKIRIPLAQGERTHTIWEFKEVLARRAADFVRPDVGLAGGITHCVKIAALAEAHHARLVAHNYVSPLLTAATAQLYAVVPNVGTLEYTLLDEEDAARGSLLATPLVREGGYLRIPDAPGLGVELAPDLPGLGSFQRWRPLQLLECPDGSVYTR